MRCSTIRPRNCSVARLALAALAINALAIGPASAGGGPPVDADGPYSVESGQAITLSANGELQRERLREIALALQNHESIYNRFPPAFVTDADGNPLFSWRVLLLPLLGEGALFAQFDTTKAWDHPDNLPVLAQMPDVYRGPGDAATATDTAYAGVYRPFVSGSMMNTFFEGPQADPTGVDIFTGTVGFGQLLDGSSNTAAAGETAGGQIPWTAPLDGNVTTTPALGDANGFSSQLGSAVPFAFADGLVRFVATSNDPADVEAMYTRDALDSIAGLVDIDYGRDQVVSYQWDFDNDGLYDDASDAAPVFDATGLVAGNYPVALKITDVSGAMRFATTTVTVTAISDTDSDGVADTDDNCTLAANPAQADTDADGHGNACDPDLNQDCRVNFMDLGALKLVFLGTDPDADFNGDGVVNLPDLAILRSLFLGTPGPSASPALCSP